MKKKTFKEYQKLFIGRMAITILVVSLWIPVQIVCFFLNFGKGGYGGMTFMEVMRETWEEEV